MHFSDVFAAARFELKRFVRQRIRMLHFTQVSVALFAAFSMQGNRQRHPPEHRGT